jgi:hypothetical protein
MSSMYSTFFRSTNPSSLPVPSAARSGGGGMCVCVCVCVCVFCVCVVCVCVCVCCKRGEAHKSEWDKDRAIRVGWGGQMKSAAMGGPQTQL